METHLGLMHINIKIVGAIFVFSCFVTQTKAIPPLEEGKSLARKWITTNFESGGTTVPFSFVYDGQSSTKFLETWEHASSSKEKANRRTERNIIYRDPKTKLEVRCEVIEYQDFPTVEWTLYFKNTGSTDTPVLENIQPLYVELTGSEKGDFLLHHFRGSYGGPAEYQPLETPLAERWTELNFSAFTGRPSEKDMPYFNLEWNGAGVLLAVGWPGQWDAHFTRVGRNVARLRAGQELTHFKLWPGEEVRTPLIVLQFWKGGDWIDAQNIWRRWMLAHNLPRPGGKLPPAQWAGTSAGVYHEMSKATEENQKMFIDRYIEERLEIDTWWMDAYWFQLSPVDGGMRDSFWFPDPERFPNGMRPVVDYARSKGMKSILWFEPENYVAGSWLKNNHPEYMLSIDVWASHDLLDWGNPEALKFIIENQRELITKEGIDTYRLDFNFNPLRWWRDNDAEDRQGITEIGYVSGYLAFYDALQERHPNLLIDNCSSGGRRNDLESMRRSVPLWRSDYAYDPIACQSQTHGLAFWLPYFGTAHRDADPYTFRSIMTPGLLTNLDLRDRELDYELLRRLTDQWRQTANYYFGDYYPLTPYSLKENVWMAWQFDRPDLGEGMVQAFRRKGVDDPSCPLKLRGLEPEAQYEIVNFDVTEKSNMNGRELTEKGLLINIPDQPGAVVVIYKRIR